MRVYIHSSPGWSRDSLMLVRERLEFALGRFSGRVRSLSVRCTDVNGPRGGHDKKCRIHVRLEHPSRTILIEDIDVDPATVIRRAALRTARTVARAIDSAGDWRVLERAH
jgi:hypothetical protein